MKRTPVLSAQIAVLPQFARSVQLERDAGTSIVDAYMPTARALDLLARIVDAMADPMAGRAWSVVGPYGSGKSSFALYLDALFGPEDAPGRAHALEEIQGIAPEVAEQLDQLRERAGVGTTGYLRMFATASREPVSLTLLRAIESGLSKYGLLDERSGAARRLTQALRSVKSTGAVPDSRALLELVRGASAFAPVLLVIDEYGKNIEYLVDDTRDGDLFILQELAEEATGLSRTPLSVVTMQHLSLEDYLGASPTAQRREWGKVRGRFEDVAFIDSPPQVQRLVAKVFDTSAATLDLKAAIAIWADAQAASASGLGLRGFVNSSENLASCYPLHPSAVMALPELCANYGQNERTLFSFLAGGEPLAVPDFMERTGAALPLATVRLFDVYDYFLGNPATITVSASNASRWFEVATRVRETQSIGESDLRCLKTVGVLNLISQGGALRASQAIVSWALVGSDGFMDDAAVRSALDRLSALGALTYRSFADEYRVWQGSDFDFAAAIGRARDRLASHSRAAILERALPLGPAVAARHSQQTGSLRYFARHFVDRTTLERIMSSASAGDGFVLYAVEELEMEEAGDERPVLVAYSDDLAILSDLALETAALIEVVEGDDAVAADWVARRELRERSAMARETLASEFHLLARQLTYRRFGSDRVAHDKELFGNLSALLSDVCDEIYPATPIVRNEMLNRRELTSQGAKARHDLLEAVVEHQTEAQLGIEGFGPERAMYEAVLRAPGIHIQDAGRWHIAEPSATSDFRSAWDALDLMLERAAIESVSLDVLVDRLGAPPYGMLDGPIPVLLTAWLLRHADDVAVFQDGSFQPRLSIEVLERLIKAPNRFAIRFVGVSGARKRVLDRLAQTIEPRPLGPEVRNATVLQVLAPLVSLAHSLSPFAKMTRELVSARTAAIRDCLLTAREPGELLFDALPRACDMKPLASRGTSDELVDTFVVAINDAVAELSVAYEQLLRTVRERLAARLRLSEEELRTMIAARASVLVSRTLDPKVRSFMITASDQGLDEQDWLEAVAMNITGRPPQAWVDEDVERFEALLGEMVEAFRRVEHLYHGALDGPQDGFEVARITRTESDGTEQGEVLWVETSHKAILTRIIDEARQKAIDEFGPRAESALLAVHAEALLKPLGETQVEVPEDVVRKIGGTR